MKKSYRVALILSILVVVIYSIFTAVSLIRYPGTFSPLQNWLSDLGNRVTSPDGSKYYNTGIFITGVLLAIFFIALNNNRITERKAQSTILTLTQTFGVLGAIGMIFTGVFSIDIPQTHSLFSAILRICLGTAFGLSVAALRYHKEVRKWILVMGVLTTLTDLIVSVLFNKVQLLEWPVIFLFLIYCLLLGSETNRLGQGRAGIN
jgi:hypothetical membrane protein